MNGFLIQIMQEPLGIQAVADSSCPLLNGFLLVPGIWRPSHTSVMSPQHPASIARGKPCAVDQAGEASSVDVLQCCTQTHPLSFHSWCSSLLNVLQVPREHLEHPTQRHQEWYAGNSPEWSRAGTCWCRQDCVPQNPWKATGNLEARMQPGSCRSCALAAWKP